MPAWRLKLMEEKVAASAVHNTILTAAANKEQHRFKIIVTDGVFSMDGIVAKLDEICDLADQYDAINCCSRECILLLS